MDGTRSPPRWTPCAARGSAGCCVEGRAVGLDEVEAAALAGRQSLEVVIDRVQVDAESLSRLTDSVEIAYQEGGGAAFAIELPGEGEADAITHRFSERFECRACGIGYELPQPRLFSFNNPFGACPTCHGFGNTIELDLDLVVPDPGKSIAQNAIEPWTKPHYRSCLTDLKRAAKRRGVRLDVPWMDLTDEERRFVVEGDGDYEGVRGFFAWLERKKYKVHVRVFLSRYRGYQTCAGLRRGAPAARGARRAGRRAHDRRGVRA